MKTSIFCQNQLEWHGNAIEHDSDMPAAFKCLTQFTYCLT